MLVHALNQVAGGRPPTPGGREPALPQGLISGLMVAPHRRVTLMQLTLIFGGWLAMALNNPLPALALLIVLRVATDLHAHRGERGTRTK